MSGAYNGLQKKITELEPNAHYVHCAAHNLNLVIKDTVSDVPKASYFFDVVEQIYKFFAVSINRWEVFKENSPSVTLKRLNPTRWSSRLDSINALRYSYTDVLKCLTEIILKSKRKDEQSEAKGLKKKMESFEFILLLVPFDNILQPLNFVSKLLQSKNVDVISAQSMIKNAYDNLNRFRNTFEEFVTISSMIATKWGI
ncbi:zinc finger MYM-type protein 1-like [Arctopsyche grandis]|uniref:zinc finger MYM-type protein 1-like n=1 Tax=Arctopsyche grandis TaxID=121162 RepID=UPI00406D6D71